MNQIKQAISYVFLAIWLLACEKEPSFTPEPEVTVPSMPATPSEFFQVFEIELGAIPMVVVGKSFVQKIGEGEELDSQQEEVAWDFIVAFDRRLGKDTLRLKKSDRPFPIVLEDEEGNQWDFMGKALAGARKGQQLSPLHAGIGFAFIYGSMYEEAWIHHEESRSVPLGGASEDWLISTDYVVSAIGKDGIPAIDDPQFDIYEQNQSIPLMERMRTNDLVVVVEIEGETKVYPHYILDYHEIVNDIVGGQPITLTYCPLTGTARVYDRSDFPDQRFGVSGLLNASNLVPFDRSTESFWHQLDGVSIFGSRIGETLKPVNHLEMPWLTFTERFDKGLVLNEQTGFSRNYRQYPYGSYREEPSTIYFPINYWDRRISGKKRVFGISVGAKVYVFEPESFL